MKRVFGMHALRPSTTPATRRDVVDVAVGARADHRLVDARARAPPTTGTTFSKVCGLRHLRLERGQVDLHLALVVLASASALTGFDHDSWCRHAPAAPEERRGLVVVLEQAELAAELDRVRGERDARVHRHRAAPAPRNSIDLYSANAVPNLPPSHNATSFDGDARAAARRAGSTSMVSGTLNHSSPVTRRVGQLVLAHAGADAVERAPRAASANREPSASSPGST